MATSNISLGTLATGGSRPRLSGTSSEIDTTALVEALSQAKRQPAVRLETKITTNEARIAAFGQMRGALATLQATLTPLRNPPGFFGARDNLFEAKLVTAVSSGSGAAGDVLGVAVDGTVAPGSLAVVVDQLATARKFASGGVADATGDLATQVNGGAAFAGAFTLGTGGGAAASIAVDGTMDLNDVRAAINAASATTGVTASVIAVGAAESRLVLTAAATGVEVTLAAGAGDDILAKLGLSANGGATFSHPLAAPLPALFSVDGIAVQRTSNTVTDVLSGVTFELRRAEPATTVTISVSHDINGVKQQIAAFVDAHNGFRDFVATQSDLGGDGEVASDAVLFGDRTMRSVAQTVSGAVAGQVGGLPPGAVASLAAIGLHLDGDNRLTIDEARLDGKLRTDLDAVRDVFEFRTTSSSADLAVFARGNALADTSFTVAVIDADADGTAESATIDGVAVDVVGGRLVGRDGTAYQGLELLWTGQGSASIAMTATRGVAETLFNDLDAALDDVNGALTNVSDDLAERNAAYALEIERIDARVAAFREQLIQKFTAMEAALSLAKSMLAQVKAGMSQSSDS